MSLNCLTCQALPRTDSDREYVGPETPHARICCIKVERSWSENISPPPYDQNGSSTGFFTRKSKKGHQRHVSSGAVSFNDNGEPRLVRSSGVRRNWSFEDLTMRQSDGDRIGYRIF